MKIRPIGNRVVLKPVEKSQTKDGILIPDAIKENQCILLCWVLEKDGLIMKEPLFR